ncbi:Flp family type IVb pilin [Fontivita pretiosa]|uniref:Flp family type IVb pilin n=1 Tax=Fontivita pretiosa TaxID=2989684 RepID=UPI003D184409
MHSHNSSGGSDQGSERAFVREDGAASQVEYGLMVALIALISLLAVVMIGQMTAGTFQTTDEVVRGVNDGTQQVQPSP